MPFIIGVDFPEDIKVFSVEGLSLNSNYYREGEFPFLPPDEHGKIVGAVDDSGTLMRMDRLRVYLSEMRGFAILRYANSL